MTRLTSGLAFALAVGLGSSFGSPAFAETQAELAARLNEEGKVLMYADRYAEASAKFRDAVARGPEARYFYNLCASLYKEGKFGEALTACNAVANMNPGAELQAKSDKLTQGIKDEAKRQGIDVQPTGGGGADMNCAANPADPRCAQTPPPDLCATNPQDPACQVGATPPAPQPQAVGKPPTQDILASSTPDNKYTWTLGVELFGGGGQIGQKDFYGTAGTGFRIKGDYLLDAASRVGAQGYFQLTHFGKGDEDMGEPLTLDIFDVGIAAYKHLCPRGTQRLCLTPLAGVQLALMSPAGAGDGTGSRVFQYAAVGARLEVGAHYAFGSRFEHVLGVALGVNAYSAVFSGPSDEDFDMPSIAQVGLDKGGASAYLGVGYTYRFNTPLGSSPFVTLE
ncbi:MAG: hypothetical protein M3680_14700 [Myxococcota bacterium]|nr:hypothetical protein [Myxococcota bacterium]